MVSKTIFILLDETGNSLLKHRDIEGLSNVAKMARALHSNEQQCIYYDPGANTGGYSGGMIDGMFAANLYAKLQQAYVFLVDNYQPGDKLILMGFGRGAYTVQILAGVVGEIGIVRKKYKAVLDNVFYAYRSSNKTKSKPLLEAKIARLSQHFCHPDKEIHFLGVWDTVGLVGMPVRFMQCLSKRYIGLLDGRLPTQVVHAYQALAIDEKRRVLKPVMWQFDADYCPAKQGRDIEQRWFSGNHSDIGGGYLNSRLSDESLRWMLEKLQHSVDSLAIDQGFVEPILANCQTSYAITDLHDSYSGIYQLQLRCRRKVNLTSSAVNGFKSFETIDDSVCQRYSQSDYLPVNISVGNLSGIGNVVRRDRKRLSSKRGKAQTNKVQPEKTQSSKVQGKKKTKNKRNKNKAPAVV